MQKGFSLFTPLVGTAIVIMAIVASVTMMQSDVRISRSLAKSYEISSQEVIAKLIKAVAEMHIIANLKSETLSDLATGYTVACSGNADNCVDEVESSMLNSLRSIKANLFRGLSEAFENIMCTGCETDLDEEKEKIMSDIIRNLPALNVEFDDGHLKETINSDVLSDYKGIFSVTFNDARGNRIQIPIVLHDFSYTTDDKIQDFIQATADSFIELKKVGLADPSTVAGEIEDAIKNYFNPCAGFGKIEELNTFVYYQGQPQGGQASISNAALEIVWRVEDGNTFYLKMCDPRCEPTQIGYLEKQLACECFSGTLECQAM